VRACGTFWSPEDCSVKLADPLQYACSSSSHRSSPPSFHLPFKTGSPWRANPTPYCLNTALLSANPTRLTYWTPSAGGSTLSSRRVDLSKRTKNERSSPAPPPTPTSATPSHPSRAVRPPNPNGSRRGDDQSRTRAVRSSFPPFFSMVQKRQLRGTGSVVSPAFLPSDRHQQSHHDLECDYDHELSPLFFSCSLSSTLSLSSTSTPVSTLVPPTEC
jgi:hypothetical protein